MSLIGSPSEKTVASAWKNSMKNILEVKSQDDIPELNLYQCGTCEMHSLNEAKEIAEDILSHDISVMSNKELFLSEEKMKKLGI